MHSETNTSKVMIWDWPIRVFHWAFVLCVGGALALALMTEAGSRLFVWHMLLGIAACFLLLVRVALGLFGSRYNRFTALLFSPAETFRYCWGIVTFRPIHYVAHNPGAAAAAFGMYGSVVILFWSGLTADGEIVRNIHGYLAYVLFALAIAHLAGVSANAVRSRGEAALSMLTGRRTGSPEEGLASSQPMVGLVIVLISVLWIGNLFASYNAVKGTVKLPLLGCTLHLDSDAPASPPQK